MRNPDVSTEQDHSGKGVATASRMHRIFGVAGKDRGFLIENQNQRAFERDNAEWLVTCV
jgi:hypothetical protein